VALDNNTKHQLQESCYHEHNMIIYEDLYTFRELYCKYSKEALEKNNDIVLVATTYEAPNNIRDMLCDYEVNVKYHESNGSLIIIDSVQGYQMGDIYGLLRLIQLLGIRAQKHAKNGIFCISDMGSFFLFNREKELIHYELSIPKNIEIPVKAFCCYHKKDFALRLTTEEQRHLTNHHLRTLSSSTFFS
jgi:MEDS: MEthanogen/methylotroph, DcmR Sensory domain